MAGINHEAVKVKGETGQATEWNADHVQKGHHDCLQYQFLNQVIENRTDFPAGPVKGQVIFRTDHNKFYVWNGTEWATFVSPATIVVAADGSGHTTDIQEGINLLPAGGGVVYVKEGTYTITSSINITSNDVAIMGSGKSTKIVSLGNIIVFNVGYDPTVTYTGILISDLYIYGSGAGALNYGIASRANESIINNIWIENCGNSGIFWGGGGTDSLISSCNIKSNAGLGIQTVGDGMMIINNVVYLNSNNGITVAGTYVIVSNNHVYSNVRIGISVVQANDCVISGNVVEGNDSGNIASYDGIALLSECDRCIVANNRCKDNDRYEINVVNANCDKNIIIGNICIGTDHVGAINDAGTNTHPNGASGTTNLQLDDLNIIA